MNKTNTNRNLWTRIASAMLAAIMAVGLTILPAQAACSIKKAEYEGNGKVEVKFTSKVTYPALKVTVKNSSGTKMSVKVIEKDDDDLEFKIKGFKAGQTYTYKISGIRKKGESKNSSVSGKITIPKSNGSVSVKKVEYDAEDREVDIEFAGKVQWKNPKVVIKNGKTDYVRKITDKGSDDIEVSVKALKKGVTYTYTISGIRKKGASKYGTVTGTFTY